MNRSVRFFVGLSALALSTLALAEPTIDQVYNATRSGNLVEARAMMQEVLKAHPNSGKAHFVEAEVLARSGDVNGARSELALAEQLEPGLPSIKPRAVEELRQELASPHSGGMPAGAHAPASTGISWGWILIFGGLGLLLVMWLVRRQAQQNVVYTQQPPGGYYPPGGVPMGTPMAPMGGGGMGSGLMGSLATGAALGAGMVAGEALAHRLVDGPGNPGTGNVAPESWGGASNADLGGQDFGVADSGSWDNGGGSWDASSGDSGGSDWT